MSASITQRSSLEMPVPQSKIRKIPVYSKAEGVGAVRWVASSNESPIPPASGVLKAVTESVKTGNRYPSMSGEALIKALSLRYQLHKDQIVVGGGSLSVLQQALTAFTGPGSEVVYGWRSYEAYPIAVHVAGADPIEVPLIDGTTHDLKAMVRAITPRTRAVILCNPNNPTGTALAVGAIKSFLQQVPPNVLVVLDEAYQEFVESESDALDLLADFHNLMVMRTFSKAYGMAGLRAGYAFGHPHLLDGVRKVAPPFGLSSVAEAAAIAALADTKHMERIVTTITKDRRAFLDALEVRGLQIPPSQANFVWVPTVHFAEQIVEECLSRGTSVRAFPGEGVRITVGEEGARQAVLGALDVLLPDLLNELHTRESAG